MKKAQTVESLDKIPVTSLHRVGDKVAGRLARLHIHTVQDLLFHLPLRYEDRTRQYPIGSLRPGLQVAIEGEVMLADVVFGRRRSLLVKLADSTGLITLRFFHFSNAQRLQLEQGVRLRCFGEVRNGPNSLEMVHPEYKRINAGEPPISETHLTPVYPTTEGVHQLTLRGLTEQALNLLNTYQEQITDWLPAGIAAELQLPGLIESIQYLHRPEVDADSDLLMMGDHPAQQRLAFEELLAHQLSLREARRRLRQHPAPELSEIQGLSNQLLVQLPFELTSAQHRVWAEIQRDLSQSIPMQRLIQGDVGSGKTIVSALAALQAIDAGWQVALMAPTELLSEQHIRNFRQWLAPLGIEVTGLNSGLKGSERSAALERIQNGETMMVIGTHALFQQEVSFNRLGLVMIDEQHRFGVHQRLALREKGSQDGMMPHQLILTATPIPRTLAMTAYADLDLSIIDELPPGRKPIHTLVLSDKRRDEVIDRVRVACAQGRQAYWVCTLIEESEALQCQAAEDSARLLCEQLPELQVGLVHGRLKSDEKERIMGGFNRGEVDLIVATTVIEVGVDVPNASLMIIENPERLGLAQLHQLRGRVGRGHEESHCLLMYRPPLSRNASDRLAVMRETNDGFAIARKDLEMRGPGEVLGTRQTGELQFRIADIGRDQHLLEGIGPIADRLLAESPQAAAGLMRRWVGSRSEYSKA